MNEIKETAKKLDIAQYKAAMLEYVNVLEEERKLKSKKEKLKGIVDAAMSKLGINASVVEIPESDQYAVAYHYTQTQSSWDADLAAKLIDHDTLAKIRKVGSVDCFTVKRMNLESAKKYGEVV